MSLLNFKRHDYEKIIQDPEIVQLRKVISLIQKYLFNSEHIELKLKKSDELAKKLLNHIFHLQNETENDEKRLICSAEPKKKISGFGSR